MTHELPEDDADERTVVVERARAAEAAPAPDADLERTIVRPRRGRRAAGVDEGDERTIVVQRRAPADEETMVVDRGARGVSADADERTVVVARDDEDDDTRVVDPDDDRTVARVRTDDDATIARPRREDDDRTVARPRRDDDATVVSGAPEASASSLPPVPSLRRVRGERRRGIAPPPLPAGFTRAPSAAVGPGAVEHYAPRELPAPPTAAPASVNPAALARVPDAALPSVARRARRTAIASLAAFAAACLVSVTGLVLIVLWMLL